MSCCNSNYETPIDFDAVNELLPSDGGQVESEEVACPDDESKVPYKTQTMTLARALAYKKRVIERLRNVESDIEANNSVIAGQDREADVDLLVEERHRLVNHMIDLKVAIQNANGPIQRFILELSEMKSENDFFCRIPTLHGARQNSYVYDPAQSATVTYNAVIRKAQVDELVKRNNARIDRIQDKIEAHNHGTSIMIEDIGLLS